jgi:AcrR family transcriptional regulator
MATQVERREATRAAILSAAHELFSTRGYAQTAVSDILEAARISRGAMYHHFAAKEDVFAAVFVRTSDEAIRRATARIPSSATPLESLVAGCLGWLRAVDDPEIRQVLLVDGPTALGWERARALEETSSLGVVRASIAASVRSGEMTVPSVDLAARLINAMLTEAALHLSQGKRHRSHRRQVAVTVTAMIEGLATGRTIPARSSASAS